MKQYLIDTHIVLWWLADDPKLTPKIKETISNPDNSVFISVVSLWEINIKDSIGKLQIEKDYLRYLKQEGFDFLSVTTEHVMKLQELPSYHQDPFDRLLICQSIVQGLTFITLDKKIIQYPVNVYQP